MKNPKMQETEPCSLIVWQSDDLHIFPFMSLALCGIVWFDRRVGKADFEENKVEVCLGRDGLD